MHKTAVDERSKNVIKIPQKLKLQKLAAAKRNKLLLKTTAVIRELEEPLDCVHSFQIWNRAFFAHKHNDAVSENKVVLQLESAECDTVGKK